MENTPATRKRFTKRTDGTHKFPKYRANYVENAEAYKLRMKKIRDGLKDEFIAEYGGKCECCAETASEFLTIDHIKGGGTKHRKAIGPTSQLIRILKRQGWPKGEYRLLCMNCNLAYGRFGYCPHKRVN
jgi:hypothetical protein